MIRRPVFLSAWTDSWSRACIRHVCRWTCCSTFCLTSLWPDGSVAAARGRAGPELPRSPSRAGAPTSSSSAIRRRAMPSSPARQALNTSPAAMPPCRCRASSATGSGEALPVLPIEGRAYPVMLLSWLTGHVLGEADLSRAALRRLGRMLARLGVAHARLHSRRTGRKRDLVWDTQHAGDLADHVEGLLAGRPAAGARGPVHAPGGDRAEACEAAQPDHPRRHPSLQYPHGRRCNDHRPHRLRRPGACAAGAGSVQRRRRFPLSRPRSRRHHLRDGARLLPGRRRWRRRKPR